MTKIQLKRSSALNNATTSRAPSSAQLDYGELAINYNSTDPQLFIKDSSGSVIRILDSYAKVAGTTFTGDVNFDGNVKIKGDSTNGAGKLTLSCETDLYAVNIKAPPTSATASYTLTLPNSAGSNSQVLTTDGSGNLSWALSSMSTADKTKLDGIETGATADQTSAEIKSLYESEADTNAFTDALLNKLNNIASGAQVNPTVVSAFTNDAGYITSADGGNAQTLDGLDSTQFLRSDASDTTTGTIEISPNADRTLVLNRNIPTPSNYYAGLQLEIRATSGTSGIGLHRNGYSHVGIYHDTTNLLKFAFNSGTVNLYRNTGDIYGSGVRAMYLNAGASGSYGNEITVGNSSPQFTVRDTNLRPIIQATGQYPCLSLNHTVTTNSNHGPTIQFIHNGYDSNEQIVVGTTGQGRWLDVGFSGGGYGTNTDCNPHRGIAGWNGITPVRVFSNGVLVGATGTYPNHIQSTANALEVRGSTELFGVLTLNSGGGSTYGWIKGFPNNNHFHTIRADVTGSTSSPSVSAGHYHNFVEYLNSDSYGFKFKRSDTGTYTDICTITRVGLTHVGNITAYSDIRLKENIKVIPDALKKISTLRGVTYNRIDLTNKNRQSGVIAQEVEKVLPEVVQENEEGIKSVAYGNMVGLLIESIKELKRNVDDLAIEIDSLKEC